MDFYQNPFELEVKTTEEHPPEPVEMPEPQSIFDVGDKLLPAGAIVILGSRRFAADGNGGLIPVKDSESEAPTASRITLILAGLVGAGFFLHLVFNRPSPVSDRIIPANQTQLAGIANEEPAEPEPLEESLGIQQERVLSLLANVVELSREQAKQANLKRCDFYLQQFSKDPEVPLDVLLGREINRQLIHVSSAQPGKTADEQMPIAARSFVGNAEDSAVARAVSGDSEAIALALLTTMSRNLPPGHELQGKNFCNGAVSLAELFEAQQNLINNYTIYRSSQSQQRIRNQQIREQQREENEARLQQSRQGLEAEGNELPTAP